MKTIFSKLILFSAIVLLLTTLSCKKFLDINYSPNDPSTSTVDLVFPAAVVSSAKVFGGYWQFLGGIWAQHWTSSPNSPGFQSLETYSMTSGDIYTDTRTWVSMYTGSLMDYQWVRDRSEADENWTYYLMATVMQCYSFQYLVDLYDKIPYSTALQAKLPTYDSGQDVYDNLIVRIDYALDKYKNSCQNCKTPGKEDIIFGGDMQNWVRFANTLKLKIYLRQVYVNRAAAESGITALYQSGAEFLNADAVMSQYIDESGRDNPAYATEWRGGNTSIVASNTLLTYLVKKGDKRLDKIFTPLADGITYKGMFQGDLQNKISYPGVQNVKLSKCIVTASQPVFFMSKAESYFLQAEANARFTSLGGNASLLYQDGVNADFSRLSATEPETVYGVGFGVMQYPTSGSEEEKVEVIIFQKWISMANIQGLEAFIEHNRTHFPKEAALQPYDELFTPSGYDGGEFLVSYTGVLSPPIRFPKRLLFPSTEVNRNPNTPPSSPINTKVWWDVKN